MYLIGDIGINHNGYLDLAIKMIDAAKSAGVDVVKFQKRNPEICIPKNQKHVVKNTIFGRMEYIDYKNRLEFGAEQYDVIAEHCKEIGMPFSMSVWDMDSYKFFMSYVYRGYDIPFIKIPSALLTHRELLIAAARSGKDVYLGCGMSSLDQIDLAYQTLHEANSNVKIVLLKCNSSYPTKEEDSNLWMIDYLKQRYRNSNTTIGYSGHEIGIEPTCIALAMGVNIIERHITTDISMPGTDQTCSLSPNMITELVRRAEVYRKCYGCWWDVSLYSQEEVCKKLRYINDI